jgi:serine/threonine protein kinase
MSKPRNGKLREPSAVDDARVIAALEEYTAALEAGTPPDRVAFLSRHADVAEALADCLSGLELVHEMSPPDATTGPGETAAPAGEGPLAGMCLGDYRIRRELGRGGMGVVYEAEQISLSRPVALKVLPFAATVDSRQLQRFHNEAKAAACLHHTNIVPVFGVGRERGIHFYAMQLIEGQTLAAVIADLSRARGDKTPPSAEPPTTAYGAAPAAASTAPRAALTTEGSVQSAAYFRTVARLGMQAAEALDYAHQMGVVHRDVKPGNLIVDSRGDVWVTDFGLAQLRDGEAGLTMTGDLVGTLRYMSPEQALAKRVVIDHRTDVYSLGMTLYELLTLRPAFPGSDRQELLRQVAFDEPTAPRKVNRAIPHELETIVLKAVEKNPAERYATAQELADDLRRFLSDDPIRARRPTAFQRARRWARRRQAVVVTAAVGLLLTLGVAAGAVGWVVRDQNARQAEAEAPVRAAVEESERLWKEKKVPAALSAALRAEGLLAQAGGHPRLGPEVQGLIKDFRMLVDLEEIRLGASAVKDDHFDWGTATERSEKAFRAYGIDLVALSVEDAAARIRASRIRSELIQALDQWAFMRSSTSKDDGRKLFAVAQAADPNEWRGRMRDLLAKDREAAIAELVRPGNAERPPGMTLELLAGWAAKTNPALSANSYPFCGDSSKNNRTIFGSITTWPPRSPIWTPRRRRRPSASTGQPSHSSRAAPGCA